MKTMNELIPRKSEKRKYWLIYSKLTGGFNRGKLHSVYLDIFINEEEFDSITSELNWEEFESIVGIHGAHVYDDAIKYCKLKNPKVTECEIDVDVDVSLTEVMSSLISNYYTLFDSIN